MSPRPLLATLGVLLALPSLALGSSRWLTRQWQSDDGLPNNIVTSLAQTPDGYLWVATPSGLARFDGVRFDDIALTRVVPEASPRISALLMDREGGVWLSGAEKALHLQDGVVRAFSTQASGYLPQTLTEADDGSIWITFRGPRDGVRTLVASSFCAQPQTSIAESRLIILRHAWLPSIRPGPVAPAPILRPTEHTLRTQSWKSGPFPYGAEPGTKDDVGKIRHTLPSARVAFGIGPLKRAVRGSDGCIGVTVHPAQKARGDYHNHNRSDGRSSRNFVEQVFLSGPINFWAPSQINDHATFLRTMFRKRPCFIKIVADSSYQNDHRNLNDCLTCRFSADSHRLKASQKIGTTGIGGTYFVRFGIGKLRGQDASC